MLAPTSRLLNLLDQYGARAVFFIDMLYVHRLNEIAALYPNAQKDLDAVKRQIVAIANKGHYVFNHLHPHWLDAKYIAEENQWDLSDTSKYSFLALTEIERDFVFEKMMTLLEQILQGTRNKPLTDGFRAGGLYIQPFSIFRPYFERYKIKYDFSVLIGARGQLKDNSNRFDFSSVKKNIYRFTEEVEVEDAAGIYCEYALRLFEMPFGARLRNSVLHRIHNRFRNDYHKYGDGLSMSNLIVPDKKGAGISSETFSVELLNEVKLPLYLSEAKDRGYLHLLSHPKLISEYNLRIFSFFLDRITSQEEVEFDFEQFILS